MVIAKSQLYRLGEMIIEEIKKNFESEKLSGNLVNTIEIVANPDNVQVIIPALKYDVNYYKERGIIKHTNGSYASEVNKTGGFSGKHKYYAELAVHRALITWLQTEMRATDYGIKEETVII